MRTIMLMAAAAIAAWISFGGTASAERICRQVCETGFCATRCSDSNNHIFLDDGDRNFYFEHGRPDVFMDQQ